VGHYFLDVLLIVAQLLISSLQQNDLFLVLLAVDVPLELIEDDLLDLQVVAVVQEEVVPVVCSSLEELDILFLVAKKRASNAVDIVEQGLPPNVGEEHRVVLLENLPVLYSDGEATALSKGLIDEHASAIVGSLERPNDCSTRVPQLELNLFVDFVADVVEPIFDENDFVDVVKLREDNRVGLQVDGVQELQKHNHEILILKVLPGVKAELIPAALVLDTEVLHELLQEREV